ncbi:Hypothetical predicted protein, partial [Pelobates cultripes]
TKYTLETNRMFNGHISSLFKTEPEWISRLILFDRDDGEFMEEWYTLMDNLSFQTMTFIIKRRQLTL